MKIVGHTSENVPIKQICIDGNELELDERYPLVDIYENDNRFVISGTEDQFKSFIAMIIRDVESDRDDVFTKTFSELQKSKIIK